MHGPTRLSCLGLRKERPQNQQNNNKCCFSCPKCACSYMKMIHLLMPRIHVRCPSGILAPRNLSFPTTIPCKASPRRFRCAVTLNASTKLKTFRSNKHDKKKSQNKIHTNAFHYSLIHVVVKQLYCPKLRQNLSAKSESFTQINHALQRQLWGFSMLIPRSPSPAGNWMGSNGSDS